MVLLAQLRRHPHDNTNELISPTGMVLDRGRKVDRRDDRILLGLEMRLPERLRSIRAWARPVWSAGNQQGLRIVKMSDVDRLTLAEHLDLLKMRGAPAC